MMMDPFPLPHINATLQIVHSSNWFSLFDLAEGYLQLAMEEGDIKKTAFRVRSLVLHEFPAMSFELMNVGSSLCHAIKHCLGDQQFSTVLLHLGDICIFAPSIDAVLD